jgi:hypothetical protein
MLRCSSAGNEKTNIFVALYFSGQEKHFSEVPFVTVWQFAGEPYRRLVYCRWVPNYPIDGV